MPYFDDQTRLMQALFAAAATRPISAEKAGPWRSFLELLRDTTQADDATLTWDRTGSAATWTIDDGPGLDPALLRRMRFDRIYTEGDLPEIAPCSAFLRLVRVRVDAGSTATLSIHRKSSEKEFRSADAHYLNAVAPFLGQAVSLHSSLQAERALAALNEQLSEDLGVRWILLDISAVIVGCSSTDAMWNAKIDLRLGDRRRLEFSDLGRAQLFHEAFAACVAGTKRAPVTVSTDPFVELVLRRISWRGEAMVLAIVRTVPALSSFPQDNLAAHFDLSPSQARLAAYLCDGYSIQEAAKLLGWTEGTARTCSKAIYARLDVTGQSGLLRRVLNSAVWLSGNVL